MKKVSSLLPILVLIIVILIFFWKFFLRGLLPIPADTIVGMYHPWRDLFAEKYPNGIPFKNFLITDSVRQQYPWRKLAIELLQQGRWPLWNPYTFAGVPLLGNFQSAPFYPLNISFFFLPFDLAWAFLVILEPLLAGLFVYLYLRHFNLRQEACFLGAISFSFSGFFIAWLEWNTILHVALWLPLILLSVEKVLDWFNYENSKLEAQSTKLQFKAKSLILWSAVFVLSLVSSFLAGHLQIFFYVFLTSLTYTVIRVLSLKNKKRGKVFLLFTFYFLLFTFFASIQWLPTLKFINLSAREVDQVNWQKEEGWFIPWQHLIQFLAPDFFGNPTTLNYWGVWNYGELVGYIGVLPFIMAILALVWRKDKKNFFFGSLFFVSLIFALPTPFAKLPYHFKIPFLSSSQPTRLLFLTDFSLAILAALGFDYFLRRKSKVVQTIKLFSVFILAYAGLWLFVLASGRWLRTEEWMTNLAVTKRNLILPTGLFIGSATFLCFISRIRDERLRRITNYLLLITVVFDLFRFGWKFTPFVKKDWIFPLTKTIEFLKKDKGIFRFMTTDRRIFPPNFSINYKLQSIDGYDPLYLLRYGELITSSERGKPDISPPFGFNRIITPQNYESRIVDLLNVKYILSLKDENSPKLVKVFQEGQTRVYENKNVLPRAFLVYDYKVAQNKQEAIEFLMDENIDLSKTAILEEDIGIKFSQVKENEVFITDYSEQHIGIEIKTDKSGILILSDNFYPGWQAMIDGAEESVETCRANYTFRGMIVPEGKHRVDLFPSL